MIEYFAMAVMATIVGAYLVNKSNTTNAAPPIASTSSNPVSIGATPVALSQVGGINTSQAVGLSITGANVGVSAAAGLGMIDATSNVAKAVPIVGSIVGIGLSVYNMIAAHHQQALANEGKVLNSTDSMAISDLVAIVNAVSSGQITTYANASQLIDTVVADWYLQVKSIQRGTWPYTLSTNQDPSILAGVGVGGPGDPSPGEVNWFGINISGDTRPGTCNAACVVGHYFIERDAAIAKLTVQAILAGQHGVMTFPKLPPYATQSGVPAMQLRY